MRKYYFFMNRLNSSSPESGSKESTRLKQVLALGLAGTVLGGCAGVQRPDDNEQPSLRTQIDVGMCSSFVLDAQRAVEEAQKGLAAGTENGCDSAVYSIEEIAETRARMSSCFRRIFDTLHSLADERATADGMHAAWGEWPKGGDLQQLRRQVRRQCYGSRQEKGAPPSATSEGK